MRNVLLTVQFDGTRFHGWQTQPKLRTVQDTLRDAIETMVQHPVKVFGTSRTDAGVHAKALPVNFETTRDIPHHGFVRGLNTLLAKDISVLDATDVPPGWKARYESVAKTYTYRIQLGQARSALLGRYAWHLRLRQLDLPSMRDAASRMLGAHDFEAFRSARCDATNAYRMIHAIDIDAPDHDNVVSIRVTGNAFLRNMVRIIAGTLVDIGKGRYRPDLIDALLLNKDRTQAGQTAPPQGLTLTKVYFEGYPRLGKPDSSLASTNATGVAPSANA